MRRLRHTAFAALTILLLIAPDPALAAKRSRRPPAAKCTGSTPCRACKNCRYCQHCAKNGGTCGVCRNRHGRGSWKQAAADAAH